MCLLLKIQWQTLKNWSKHSWNIEWSNFRRKCYEQYCFAFRSASSSTLLVRLNCLPTCVRSFCASLRNCGMATSLNCGAENQTEEHNTECSLNSPFHETDALIRLDKTCSRYPWDKNTKSWLQGVEINFFNNLPVGQVISNVYLPGASIPGGEGSGPPKDMHWGGPKSKGPPQ